MSARDLVGLPTVAAQHSHTAIAPPAYRQLSNRVSRNDASLDNHNQVRHTRMCLLRGIGEPRSAGALGVATLFTLMQQLSA